MIKKRGERRRKEERSGKGQGSLITPPHFKVTHCHSLNEQTQSVCWVKALSLQNRVGNIRQTESDCVQRPHSCVKIRTYSFETHSSFRIKVHCKPNDENKVVGDEQWSPITRNTLTQLSVCVSGWKWCLL